MSVDLFLEEKKFISVKRASEETGYSQDYIGQLCRHGKVPAKLVGRTWFVNSESLENHRKGSGQKGVKKNKATHELNSNLVLPISVENTKSFSYVSEPVSVLPDLVKNRPKLNRVFDSKNLHSRTVHLAVSFLVVVFVVSNTAFAWMSYISPRQSEIVTSYLVSTYGHLVDSVNKLGDRIQLAIAAGSVDPMDKPASSESLVVFQDSEDRLQKTEAVKNSFSDDVEVFFDNGGESGVIKPVFKPGDNTDNYAFVMVPVKQKNESK
jgi:hypothetical protein